MLDKEIRQEKKEYNGIKSFPTVDGRERNYNNIDRAFIIAELKNFWMVVAKFSSILNLILFLSLGFYVQKNKYIPYVIEVGNDGRVLNSSIIKSGTLEHNDKQINYFLTQFISNLSSVSSDENVQNNRIKSLNYFLTTNTQQKVMQFLNDENVKGKVLEKMSANVEILSINPVPGQENSYQIRWNIINFNKEGQIEKKETYNGLFKVTFIKIKDEEKALNNPLGIIINDFNITKEIH